MRLAVAAVALICAAPPALATATGTLTKTFDNSTSRTVVLGGQILMRLTVSITYSPGNGNILNITDTLPAGMEVAPAVDQPQLPSTCTVANSTFSAVPGSHTVSYQYYDSAAHRTGFGCHLDVKLKAVQAGAWQNTASANSGSDNGGGPGISLTASATLTVIGPPTLTRGLSGFVPGTTDGTAWIMPGQVLTAHYTLTNPNPTTALTGVGFSEALPGGVAGGAINENTCADGVGNTGTATASSGSIVLSGVQLAAGASCALDVQIFVNDAGTYTLSTAPTSNEAGTGAAVASTFLAFDPPHVWMDTSPASGAIDLDGSGTMTLVLESMSTVDVAGMGFSATLPPGLTVANSSTPQCGGTATASAATGQLTLTGATVPANGVCNVSFTVTGTQVGSHYVDSVVTVHGALLRADFGAYFTVNPLATTTALAAAPASAVHGQSVIFTAAVSLPGGSSRAAVGTLAFTENGNPLPGGCASVVTVSVGLATCTTSALSTASHHVVATFTPGDGNTKTSAGSMDVTVGKAATTTTITNAQPWTITLGASTTVSVTVATSAPGSGVSSGAVMVSDGAGAQCVIGSLASGSGSCVLTPTSAGTRTLTAAFTPDAASSVNFAGSSATATLTIERAEQATLNLVATPDVLIPGMHSQLAASGGSGSGSVDYGVDSGPCSLSGSVVTATGVGSCIVRATKAADANYNAAIAIATITVQAAGLPVAQAQAVSASFNTAQAVQLAGSDDNIGGPYTLTYALVDAPLHGTIGSFDASAGTLTYTPNRDHIGADRFTFTVSSTNGVSQSATVTIDVIAPQLVLSIEDGGDFAHYGQVVDYSVTLTNAGGAANAVPVTFALSPGFDANAATLTCAGADNGATCVQDTTDPLHFTVTLPPGHALTWLVGAPVRADTSDDAVAFGAVAIGADAVTDTNTLVVYRDGFDVTASAVAQAARVVEGEPARAILEGVDGESGEQASDATISIIVPDDVATALSPAAWLIVRDAAREVRIEARAVAGAGFVRLRAREANGGERASAWSAAEAGAALMLGATSGEGGRRIFLLEGARESLALH